MQKSILTGEIQSSEQVSLTMIPNKEIVSNDSPNTLDILALYIYLGNALILMMSKEPKRGCSTTIDRT
jgi:hypothetical protein